MLNLWSSFIQKSTQELRSERISAIGIVTILKKLIIVAASFGTRGLKVDIADNPEYYG